MRYTVRHPKFIFAKKAQWVALCVRMIGRPVVTDEDIAEYNAACLRAWIPETMPSTLFGVTVTYGDT